MLQRSVEQLDPLGLLLRCGPLGVTLLDGSGQLLLPRTILRPQIGHQGVGLAQLRDQIGVPLLEPLHLGVLLGQLGTLVARDFLQPLRAEGMSGRYINVSGNR